MIKQENNMAALDVDELKKGTRWIVFYNIIQSKALKDRWLQVAFDNNRTMPTGKVVIKDFLELNNKKLKPLGLYPNSDQAMISKLSSIGTKTFIRVQLDSTAQSVWSKLPKLQDYEIAALPNKGGAVMRLDRLFKSVDFKGGRKDYNRGNIAEGIFSAALVARFQKEKPSFKVMKADVEAVIKVIANRAFSLEHTITDKFTSPNAPGDLLGKNPKPDKIIYKVGLGNGDMKALINKDIRSSEMAGIYTSAVRYANGQTVCDWDKRFYENDRVDIITVAAQGGADQKGTKTDVAVWFTDADGKDHKTSLEYSVKAAAVKQFSQRGGTKFETLETLFKEFYSFALGPHRLPYEEHMNATPQRIPEALSLAYNKAWASMGSGSPRSFPSSKKKQFTAAVKYHAQKLVGDMPQLNLLDTGQPDIKDFNLMAKNIETYGYWSVEQTHSNSKLAGAMLPKHVIRVHNDAQDPGKAILEIRVRVETQKSGNLYFRSVIENGKDMGILVGYLEGTSLSEREKYLA
jgi:hypothetical protein